MVLRYCAWRHYGIRFSTTGTKDQPQMYRQSHVANSCKTMRIPSIKIIIFIKFYLRLEIIFDCKNLFLKKNFEKFEIFLKILETLETSQVH